MRLPDMTSQHEPFVRGEKSYKSPHSTGSEPSTADQDDQRGRIQERDSRSTVKDDDDSGHERSTAQDIPNKGRKRKRSRKGLEKNYPCPEPGCGKSYSRAEHLYRHQLNHQPKKIYRCDHPGCERVFVRQDLRTRHKERHTARGSHLQRKENALRVAEPSGIGAPEHSGNSASTQSGQAPLGIASQTTQNMSSRQFDFATNQQSEAPRANISNETSERDNLVSAPSKSSGDQNLFISGGAPFQSTMHTHKNPLSIAEIPPKPMSATPQHFGRLPNGSHSDAYRAHSKYDLTSSSAQYRPSSASSYDSLSAPRQGNNGYTDDAIASPSAFPQLASVAAPAFNDAQSALSGPQAQLSNTSHNFSSLENVGPYDPYGLHNMHGLDTGLMDPASSNYPMAIWNGDGYNYSPHNPADDLVSLLFSDSPYPQAASPGGPRQSSMSFGANAFTEDDRHLGFGFEVMNSNGGSHVPQQHPMALNAILDPASLPANLSDEKRREVLRIIDDLFNDFSPVSKQKDEIMAGDRDSADHVLSLRQMQLYIRSYWYHFHPQMPILHKPTFSANESQNLLLIAVMAIGASCLDKIHGPDVTEAAADLANFLAWHLRGEVFKDKDFRPPAQVWIFQTLLLLEIYEKMFSTRVLHERAHLHHGTTLTLMRRGRTLIGRSPLDSPPTEKAGNSVNMDQETAASNSPEEWWHHWIKTEEARRVSFAAFIIDTIHATMFGHQAILVAHEIKLALPCDESLWSASTSAEVAKKEAELRARGFKRTTFFDGLKNTLKLKSVHTNPFGRTAIMAGLLSVTWHMNQRDVQIHHLGALKALGGRDVWRSPLTKAFDFWKRDFSTSLSKENTSSAYRMAKVDEDNIFQSHVVLHHLAHMAMHVDIVSCQIFAGARRLLGRTTLKADYDIAQKRIRYNWAPRASARDATHYAIQFLAQVLMPEAGVTYDGSISSSAYSARDDFLLNRPWALYYATLVVWTYGFALDGPLQDPPDLSTPEQKAYDMRQYLSKFSNVSGPQDLSTMSGRNGCLGLLYTLRENFEKCRWQLLHEAADLLGKCIQKLLQKESEDKVVDSR